VIGREAPTAYRGATAQPITEGVITSSRDRELPFLPTLLCLWGAGWVTSLVTSILFLGHAYSASPSPAMVAVNTLLTAAVGAVVVQYLLLTMVDYDIPYTATLLALVAGSVANTIVRLILDSQVQAGASPGVLPITGLGFAFIPSLVGAVVSWWLLQNAATAPTRPAIADAALSEIAEHPPVSRQARIFDDPLAGDATASAYSELVSAVRESALGLVGTVNSVEPSSVPTVIGEGLVPFEAATRRLEQAELPSTVSTELNQRLVTGLKQLEEDLTETAEEAATTAGSRLYQRGLFNASMADVSDGGARYRWDLEQSKGLRDVKQALSELKALGFGSL